MSFGFAMHCGMEQGMRHYLSREQRKVLAQIMSMRQELRDPEFPNAVKGYEGMVIADEFLRTQGVRGILIGGLSEAIWNRTRKLEELAQHKDVDVLILDKDFQLDEPFQEGVDWWTYDSRRISIRRDAGEIEHTREYWTNANNVILNFEFVPFGNINQSSGLYLLDRNLVIDMRYNELASKIGNVQISEDSDVSEGFERKMKAKGFANAMPKYVLDRFRDRILADCDIQFRPFEPEVVRTLNN